MNTATANREFPCHTTVRLTDNCLASGHNLRKGQVGTIVCKYDRDTAYAVEFTDHNENCFVVTVLADRLESAA